MHTLGPYSSSWDSNPNPVEVVHLDTPIAALDVAEEPAEDVLVDIVDVFSKNHHGRSQLSNRTR